MYRFASTDPDTSHIISHAAPCGKGIRRVLTDCLVDPVRTSGDSVHAFRLVWRRRTDEDGLARAWDAILSQRHLCDRPGRRADPVAADVRIVHQWSGVQRCSRPVGVSMEACLPGRQLLGRIRPGRRDRRSRPEDERPTHDGLSGGAAETDPAELFTGRW